MNTKPRDYAIKITVRNNLLLERMRAAGHDSASSLSRACGVSMSTIGGYLGMKKAPLMRRNGEPWSSQALKIAGYLKCLPEDMFPIAQMRVGMEKNYAEFTADAADVHQISESLRSMALPADEKMMVTESKQALDNLLHGLLPREERILRMRFGLDGREHTLDEIAKPWGLTRDRIRQIEANAIRKLKRAAFADKQSQEMLGRRITRSALGLENKPYTYWNREPAVISETALDKRAQAIKAILEKYARGGVGNGSPNPYEIQ